MKAKERKQARALRHRGWSVRAIAKRLHCAKGSVSEWVRDIPLTDEQIARLKSNQDKGRANAANHPNSPKQKWTRIRCDIMRAAEEEVPRKFSRLALKIVGTALYWAEGYKATVNMVSFSNSDPAMVSLMMKFFREVCRVPEEKFRGAVHIHPHLNRVRSVKFWSEVSNIPIAQFHKVHIGISRASKHKRDTLPLGTFRIVVCDARLLSKIKGWMRRLEQWGGLRAISSVG